MGHSCAAALSWPGKEVGGDAWGSLQTGGFISALFLQVTAPQSLKTDSDAFVCSLAGQTVLILGSPRVRRKSGCTFRTHGAAGAAKPGRGATFLRKRTILIKLKQEAQTHGVPQMCRALSVLSGWSHSLPLPLPAGQLPHSTPWPQACLTSLPL